MDPTSRRLFCFVQRHKRRILPVLASGSQILHPGLVLEAHGFQA